LIGVYLESVTGRRENVRAPTHIRAATNLSGYTLFPSSATNFYQLIADMLGVRREGVTVAAGRLQDSRAFTSQNLQVILHLKCSC
jgi:hypothetical protein